MRGTHRRVAPASRGDVCGAAGASTPSLCWRRCCTLSTHSSACRTFLAPSPPPPAPTSPVAQTLAAKFGHTHEHHEHITTHHMTSQHIAAQHNTSHDFTSHDFTAHRSTAQHTTVEGIGHGPIRRPRCGAPRGREHSSAASMNSSATCRGARQILRNVPRMGDEPRCRLGSTHMVRPALPHRHARGLPLRAPQRDFSPMSLRPHFHVCAFPPVPCVSTLCSHDSLRTAARFTGTAHQLHTISCTRYTT